MKTVHNEKKDATRKHSSRMRIARLWPPLNVSACGVYLPPWYTYPSPGCLPPRIRTPLGYLTHPPDTYPTPMLIVLLTDACENITFPQIRYKPNEIEEKVDRMVQVDKKDRNSPV